MPKLSPTAVYVLLAVIVVLFYGNTLRNGFVHDDIWQVVDNEQVRSLDMGRIFGGCIAQELLGGCEGRGFYWRPLQTLGYALTFQIAQSAAFFHLMNLVYFWIAGVLVYLVVGGLLKSLSSPPQKTVRPNSSNDRNNATGLTYASARQHLRSSSKHDSGLASSYFLRWIPSRFDLSARDTLDIRGTLDIRNWLPLIAAILFLTHPVNSEAVNWVSATPELLMTVFFLLAFLFYLKYLKSPRSLKYLAFSAGFWFLALLSKETAVFLIVILISADLIRMSADRARGAAKNLFSIGHLPFAIYFPFNRLSIKKSSNRKSMENGNWKMENLLVSDFKTLAVYLIPLVIYLAARSAVLGRVVYKYEGYYALSLGDQILTALALLPRYLLKLVYPLPLSFQPQVVPVREVGEVGVIGGIGVIGVVGGLGWFLYKRGERKILLGLIWMIVGILPALIFNNKLGEFIFAERYLLVSTIGLAIIAAEVITRILRGQRDREIKYTEYIKRGRTFWLLMAVFVVYFVWAWRAVYTRAGDWKDNQASYRAMIRIDPSHVKAHFQLGEILRVQGAIELAKGEYQAALAVSPDYEPAKTSLAQVSKKYQGMGLSFYFPSDWKLVEEGNLLKLSDKDNKLQVEIEIEETKVSPDGYLKSQKEILGKLVNEGPALIRGWESAWVKVWEEKSQSQSEESESQSEETESQRDRETEEIKLQFFLFSKGKVVKILVSDANLPQMKVFEGVLASITIN